MLVVVVVLVVEWELEKSSSPSQKESFLEQAQKSFNPKAAANISKSSMLLHFFFVDIERVTFDAR